MTMTNPSEWVTATDQSALEDLELRLLLEAVFVHYGYDFRDYTLASLKRQVMFLLQQGNLKTVSGLQEKVLHDPAYFERLLLAFSIHVTAMFRDPSFYLAFRHQIVPLLRTYPTIQIWLAGCATGEEVYSLAILLEEEGLSNRAQIYATDMNATLLEQAQAGIFPIRVMQQYTQNYLQAGGKRAFSGYYTARYNAVIMRASLRDNIVWAQHNLATDASFNEFNVIFCRNVMIYFSRSLQDRVHRLLYDSLARLGILALGDAESLRFTPYEACYEIVADDARLYRKVR